MQAPYGGPNYFSLDPDAVYDIHIDNDADNVEDITFRFRFSETLRDIALQVGPEGNQQTVSVPVINVGQITANDTASLNKLESYTLEVIQGPRRSGNAQSVTNANSGSTTFKKPADKIGTKTFPDYSSYADAHIWDISVPGCDATGAKVFVGQRAEGFAVNLGEAFDLVKTNPVGPADGETNTIANQNVTSLMLEIPASCLTGGDSVIGAWTTASLPQARLLNPTPIAAGSGGRGATLEAGALVQVSRLGHPLVNEVVIGLKDKDRFNASHPGDDAQFATYVTHPSFPEIL